MKFGQVDNLDSVDFNYSEIPLKTKENLSSIKRNNKIHFFFGAPGWSDVNFKGSIYPLKTSSKKMLIEYARQFNSIEFNGTRYGVPKHKVAQNWKEKVGPNFKFSLKLPQFITHRKNINDAEAYQKIDEFLLLWSEIEEYSGVNFAVMANYFRSEQFNELDKFVSHWPSDVPIAIELRDQSWFNDPSVVIRWHELFAKHNVIPVVTDTPGRRDVMHYNLTNNHLFVRYVGDFEHSSDKFRIHQWVDKMVQLVDCGVDHIWFYVHQPGENRERILHFFNYMIPLVNQELNLEIKVLKNHSEAYT